MDRWNSIYNPDGSLKAEDDPKKTLLGNAVEGLNYGYENVEEFFGPTYARQREGDDRTHQPVNYDIV